MENKHDSEAGKTFSILLAEDNEINRTLMKSFIKKLLPSAEILVAQNGVKALEVIGNNKVDLVFMDVQMPEMDGLEATEKIRSSGLTDLPVIALTASATSEDREDCLNSGMNDYLSKPVSTKRLDDTIKKYLPADTSEKTNSSEQELQENNKEVWDLDLFLESTFGNNDVADQIMNLYLEGEQGKLEAVKSAVHEKDKDKIMRSAHDIKGIAANMHAKLMKEAAYNLEQAGIKNDLDNTPELLKKLESTMQIFRKRLLKYMDEK